MNKCMRFVFITAISFCTQNQAQASFFNFDTSGFSFFDQYTWTPPPPPPPIVTTTTTTTTTTTVVDEVVTNTTFGDVALGEQGEQGLQGEQGEEGLHGEQGEEGLQGPRGIAGENGKDGVDGVDGKDGMDGKDGEDGENGKDGDPGSLESKWFEIASINYDVNPMVFEDKVAQLEISINNNLLGFYEDQGFDLDKDHCDFEGMGEVQVDPIFNVGPTQVSYVGASKVLMPRKSGSNAQIFENATNIEIIQQIHLDSKKTLTLQQIFNIRGVTLRCINGKLEQEQQGIVCRPKDDEWAHKISEIIGELFNIDEDEIQEEFYLMPLNNLRMRCRKNLI